MCRMVCGLPSFRHCLAAPKPNYLMNALNPEQHPLFSLGLCLNYVCSLQLVFSFLNPAVGSPFDLGDEELVVPSSQCLFNYEGRAPTVRCIF